MPMSFMFGLIRWILVENIYLYPSVKMVLNA